MVWILYLLGAQVVLALIEVEVLSVLGRTSVAAVVDGVVVSEETLEVLFALRDGHARERVAGVVDVRTFGGLVLETTLSLLAAEDHVALEGLLREEVLAVDVHVSTIFLS